MYLKLFRYHGSVQAGTSDKDVILIEDRTCAHGFVLFNKTSPWYQANSSDCAVSVGSLENVQKNIINTEDLRKLLCSSIQNESTLKHLRF